MHLQLIRTVRTPEATIGLLSVDGDPFCHLLEAGTSGRPGQPPAQGRSIIAAGTYEVVITYSPHYRQPTPLLLNVAGGEDVRIRGSRPAARTSNCLLVGLYDSHRAGWSISNALYAALFGLLRAAWDAGQPVYLTIA